MNKALEKDRKMRYQSAADMGADLRRLERETGSSKTVVPKEVSDSSRSVAAQTSSGPKHWGIYVGVAGLLLLLAIGGVWYQKHSAGPTAGVVAVKPSVAVLPLKNLSTDADSVYFSDGMTDEITTKLSKIQAINVAPRSASAAVKNADQNAADLGRQLGVRYLLEGTVRKSGDQVRVNVHLIDSTTGFQVWADDFTGQMKDVFSLQEQTALKIAQALNLNLSPQKTKAIEQRYTQNPQAYEAFLAGRGLLLVETPEKLEAARKNFEQALKFDPDYAPALAGLAHTEGLYYRDLDTDPIHLKRAEEYARRAILIDPNLAEAHVALGQIDGLKFDYAAGAVEDREAIRLEPDNPLAWDQLSWNTSYEQPPEAVEAEKAAREAIRLQPSSAASQYHLGRALLFQGRYQEAEVTFHRAAEIGSVTYESLGMAQLLLAQGKYDAAIRYLAKSEAGTKSVMNDYWFSAIYAAKGDNDKALASLQKAFNLGFTDFAALDASPYFKSLRHDPRYQKLIDQYRKK